MTEVRPEDVPRVLPWPLSIIEAHPQSPWIAAAIGLGLSLMLYGSLDGYWPAAAPESEKLRLAGMFAL